MNYPSKRSLLAAALALGLNFVPGLTVLAAGVIGATIFFKKQRETGRSRHGRPGLTHRLSGAVFPTPSAPLRSLFGTGAPHPLNRSRTGARILSSTFSPQGMTPGRRTPRMSPASDACAYYGDVSAIRYPPQRERTGAPNSEWSGWRHRRLHGREFRRGSAARPADWQGG